MRLGVYRRCGADTVKLCDVFDVTVASCPYWAVLF